MDNENKKVVLTQPSGYKVSSSYNQSNIRLLPTGIRGGGGSYLHLASKRFENDYIICKDSQVSSSYNQSNIRLLPTGIRGGGGSYLHLLYGCLSGVFSSSYNQSNIRLLPTGIRGGGGSYLHLLYGCLSGVCIWCIMEECC
ncbi:unnamed protein product [Rotaria sordida]|uniref:Uncharacterized protein n=1 Tax=Rotaria sordida TaxID=392033 RepID=A0A814ICB5_9BILA|nr:unnamed protein product [Rotaria sordida]